MSTFPQRPTNRPALPRIGYRLGAYPQIRDAIWRSLNRAPALAAWTHRAPDDPGVAIVEVAATVGDILTFYQELYANEAFLRTAAWPESIRELVRLTGYRLGPATGGKTFFAFTFKGDSPIEIPASFPIKAELENEDKPVDFLTSQPLTARPALSSIHLYRSRNTLAGISSGVTEFEISRVGGSQDPQLKDDLDLKQGDKLMIIPDEPSWLKGSASIGAQPPDRQMIKIKSVRRLLDRLIVESETPIQSSRSGAVRAYRIGRSFSHFGHNAPAKRHAAKKNGSEVTGTYEYDTDFRRHWDHECSQFDGSEPLEPHEIPLDQEVNDLLVGSDVILELPIDFGSIDRRIVVSREIAGLTATPFSIGDLSGSCTLVELDSSIATNISAGLPVSDLRMVRLHETTSPELQLNRKTLFSSGAFTNTNQLFHYGTSNDVQQLLDRRIILKADDGRYDLRQVVSVNSSYPHYPRMRQITLDAIPKGFSRSDFDEESPTVTVYGNVVEATQGKLEALATLGNGDMRQSFQSFKLPKSPLTYLQDPAAAPPVQPELTIRVDGREWQPVDSFFDRGPKDEVYIIRHDDEGNAWIQFGDGIMGSRLPSGIKNVTAEYRTGTGALGPVKEDTKPTAGSKLDKLDKIFLPGEVTGGSDGESHENARRNAPPKLQSLGRLVSLADYESEARSLPGAVTAKVAWDIADGSPAIAIRLLLEQAQQSDLQFEDAAISLREADKNRGLNRYPIEVTQCELRYVYLTIQYAYDDALLPADVESGIKASLGLVGDDAGERSGLFGLRNRELGQAEHRLSVEGAVQNVAGVRWCRVVHFGSLSAGNDPEELFVPTYPQNVWRIPCAPTELLQLHSRHLTLNPTDA